MIFNNRNFDFKLQGQDIEVVNQFYGFKYPLLAQ
jgi:hypothetical protein